MKAFGITLSLALMALAPTAFAQYQLEVEYSDLMVDVGDLDLFQAVWQRLYDESNQYGGLSDDTYPTYTSQCAPTGAQNDLEVTVNLDGQWGDVGDVSGWQMRDALVQTAWETVQQLTNPTGYNVYTDCTGTYWQDGTVYNTNAACGGYTGATQCECAIGSAECDNHSWGHKIPETVKVETYNGDVLLPVNFVMTFSSSTGNSESGGCGRFGAIAEVLASFVPGIGVYFDKGIKIACRQ